MEITYESIKPLIKKEVATGNQIQLEFQAKNQESPLSTMGVVVPDVNQMKKDAAKSAVKSAVKESFIRSILRSIGLGGILGSTVRNVARQTGKSNTTPTTQKITEADKQKAIVKAFEPFSSMYKYNEQTSEWEYITPNA